jgi:D-alanine-D-alanine ligase
MKKIGIFCGGFSSEFDISVKSARNIQQAIETAGNYMAYLVFVTRNNWEIEVDGERKILAQEDFSFLSKGEKLKLDAAHVYIHGNPGENGKLQAYFEMKEFPYINSGSLASAMSFDKWFCNQFLKSFGVKVAKSVLFSNINQANIANVVSELGLPLFVKPSDSGSSFGISKVYKSEELFKALSLAFQEGRTVVCEAFMDGVEVTCGVYEDEQGLHALPCTEIVSETDFFDYEAKYLGKSQEITPARISDTLTKQVQELSKKIYELLQLRSLARIDYILIGDVPHVIEVNTTPGFSSESIVPKMLQSAGISQAYFWKTIYDFELKRNNNSI